MCMYVNHIYDMDFSLEADERQQCFVTIDTITDYYWIATKLLLTKLQIADWSVSMNMLNLQYKVYIHALQVV